MQQRQQEAFSEKNISKPGDKIGHPLLKMGELGHLTLLLAKIVAKSLDHSQNGISQMLYEKATILSCKDFKLNKRDLKSWSVLSLSRHATPQATEGSKRLEVKKLHHAMAGIEKAGGRIWMVAIHN